jgi:hypothetical protein
MGKVHLERYVKTDAGVTGAGDFTDRDVFGPACRPDDYELPRELSPRWKDVTCGNCRRIIRRINREGY